jgi:hypothetical protein
MRARELTRKSSGLRLGWLTSFLLATVFLPSSLSLRLWETPPANWRTKSLQPPARRLRTRSHQPFVARRQIRARSAQRARSGVARRRRAHRQSRAGDGNCRGRSLREPARICLDGRDRDRLRRKEGRAGLLAAIANGNAFRSALPIVLKKLFCSRKSSQCSTSPWSKCPEDLA